jgi:DNA-binding transcriptional LysR family regulator
VPSRRAADIVLAPGIAAFLAVADARSFVRAGKVLGLSQSGVSRAIARLEERVQVRLFQRTARAVVLTEEGKRFHDRIAPLMAEIDAAANEAATATARATGLLRVVVDPLVARVFFEPRLAALLDPHPDLSVDLVVRSHLGDLVGEGFDAAVRFGAPPPSSLIVRKILDTRVVTCASREYLARRGRPTHPRQIADHDCILFREDTSGKPMEWVFQRGKEILPVAARGRVTVNDSSVGLAAAAAGLGIVQPLEIEMKRRLHLELVPILERWSDESYPLYLYLPRRNPPARVQALVAFLTEG